MAIRKARPFVIGLTGGIGAGKSTCSSRIKASGVPLFDCDAEVGLLYRAPDFLAALRAEFGLAEGEEKAQIRTLALQDASVRSRIVPVFTPFLERSWRTFLDTHAGDPVVVMDAPTLYETGWDRNVDASLCLIVDEAERMRRALARPAPRMTEADFRDVLAHQVTDDERRRRATCIVDGNGTPDEVAARFDAAFAMLLRERGIALPDGRAP